MSLCYFLSVNFDIDPFSKKSPGAFLSRLQQDIGLKQIGDYKISLSVKRRKLENNSRLRLAATKTLICYRYLYHNGLICFLPKRIGTEFFKI